MLGHDLLRFGQFAFPVLEKLDLGGKMQYAVRMEESVEKTPGERMRRLDTIVMTRRWALVGVAHGLVERDMLSGGELVGLCQMYCVRDIWVRRVELPGRL
jgi:hypothetical protein